MILHSTWLCCCGCDQFVWSALYSLALMTTFIQSVHNWLESWCICTVFTLFIDLIKWGPHLCTAAVFVETVNLFWLHFILILALSMILPFNTDKASTELLIFIAIMDLQSSAGYHYSYKGSPGQILCSLVSDPKALGLVICVKYTTTIP